MAEQTANYQLVKPAPEEFYDVAVPNSNMDKIDTLLKRLADILGGIDLDLTKKSQAIGKVNNLVTTHLDDIMPHKFVDGGKTYRWGFRTVDGEPEFIYEEVL